MLFSGMPLPDFVNGLFEAVGALSIWMNVQKILKDQKSRGVSWFATGFFTSWGFWNLYYYPSLGQWMSFAGGVFIVAGNSVWLFYMWKYRNA